ncbi:MAG: ROK family protein [Clostridia bacterium]|nr:ROK family protein [Clostridia bacterium]
MNYIGIDLGGTNIAVGIINEKYDMLAKGSVPTGAERDGKEIIKDMADLCAKLVAEAGLTFDDIEYAGIAAPGSIDPENGVVVYANNLPFNNFAIADILKSYIPIKKVYLENDANAAALGEAVAGAARGVKHAVMITLGTGVGGGIIIDGKIYSGFNYKGGELGHIVIQHGGRPCSCGRLGCWEAYSSATGLINMTKEKIDECNKAGISTIMAGQAASDGKVSGKTAFAAMKLGDVHAKAVVDEYISYLACGLSNIINIFQPEVLVIGGGICNEKEYLTDPLNAIISGNTYGGSADKATALKIAELGNDAGIIGAAVLGL